MQALRRSFSVAKISRTIKKQTKNVCFIAPGDKISARIAFFAYKNRIYLIKKNICDIIYLKF